MKAYLLPVYCTVCNLELRGLQSESWQVYAVQHPTAPPEWHEGERAKHLCPYDGKTFKLPTIELEEA